jgi:hypothetical protein
LVKTGAALNQATCTLCALSGMLLAALVLVVMAKLFYLAPSKPLSLPLASACDLSMTACTIALPDGGSLEIDLGKKPVPLLSRFPLRARVSDSRWQPVEVDFTGINIPMAFVRAYLKPAPDEGEYAAHSALPMCATGRMEWQATVRLEKQGRQMLAPFRFITIKS